MKIIHLRELAFPAGLSIIMFCFVLLSGCANVNQAQVAADHHPNQPVSIVWESNGIRIERIKLAANGLMLDLRYRITDLEQARALLKRNTPITLIDQVSGTVLAVPNMANVGMLRNLPTSNDTSKLLWMFFNNPGGVIKPGSRVTLAIGAVTIKDIRVAPTF
jgi:hypothetical protein